MLLFILKVRYKFVSWACAESMLAVYLDVLTEMFEDVTGIDMLLDIAAYINQKTGRLLFGRYFSLYLSLAGHRPTFSSLILVPYRGSSKR